ncbi:alpha-2-macroglobulin family protein [Salinispira pacifica]
MRTSPRSVLSALGAVVVLSLFFVSCSSGTGSSISEAAKQFGGNAPEALYVSLKESQDFSESSINYFNLANYDNSAFSIAESNEPLEVTEYGPVDELPVEIKRPTIFVTFNQPIVPLSKLGDPAGSSPIMNVQPKTDGTFRWYGSRLLAFEPSADLLSQRSFTVTISEGTTSLGGKKLGKPFSFSFHSEYLDLASVFPGAPGANEIVDPEDAPPNAARTITVSFTYPVDMNFVKDFLSVTAEGESFPFTVSRPAKGEGDLDSAFVERTILLSVTKPLPENADVQVELAQGARSSANALGRPDAVSKSFHTIKPFTYVDYDTYSYSFPRSTEGDSNPVYLRFSHPVDPKEVASHLSVNLPVTDLSKYVQVFEDTVKLNGLPVTYESTYALRIDAALKDVYGRELGVTQVVKIEVPPAASYAYFPNTGTRMLESQFAPKIIFEYQNITSGVWKVDSIENPYKSFSPAELEPYDFSGLKPNVKHYEVLDLSPWLNDAGKGFVGLSWNFSKPDKNGERSRWQQRNLQLQVTDLGVTTRYSYNRVLVWVNSLTTGQPVANATVQLKKLTEPVFEARTDARGLAEFQLKSGEFEHAFRDRTSDRIQISVVSGSDHIEFIPNHSHNQYRFGIYGSTDPINIERPRVESFIFTDRGLYKPGETVTFRGIDRTWSAGRYSVYQGDYTLRVKEYTYRAKPFRTITGRTSTSGGFYGSFTVPADLDPGTYQIEYVRDGWDQPQSVSFEVANFRRAAFQVSLEKPDRTYVVGDEISFGLRASYLAGGTLAGGNYSFFWTKQPGSFTPPGAQWENWVFGPESWGSPLSLTSGEGSLGANGEAAVKQQTSAEGVVGKPYHYQAEARVQDVSRQEIAAAASVLVHPASFYIGARLAGAKEGWWSPFVATKKPATAEMAMVDIDGSLHSAAAGHSPSPVKTTLIRHTWKLAQQRGVYGRINTRYEEVDETVSEEVVALKGARGSYSFTVEQPGSYTLRLATTDEQERGVVTELSFYATGAGWVRWGLEDSDEINLIPDRESYEVGDTAHLLVQSPLPKGSYLVTIEREGIFDERIVELEGSANVIDVPITDQFVPVIYVAVSSFTKREAPPTSYFEPDLGKPKGYFGMRTLPVSTRTRNIQAQILPDKQVYSPGGEAEVRIKVTDRGAPVQGAEVTFLAADRGVLDLINYHVPDPVAFFYDQSKFPLGVLGADSRSLLIDPVTYEIKDLPGGDDSEGKLGRRKDFTPLAVFEPYLKTDRDGIAVAKFKFPDTLTTYRATAIVVDNNRFGIQEREVTVQNPINVRAALPRRLRLRDTARAGVVVTNLSGSEQKVSVALDPGILRINGAKEKSVTVPAGGSLEVPFTIEAVVDGKTEAGAKGSDGPGGIPRSWTAKLIFTIRSVPLSEQLEESLVVERPLVEEAFTVAGRTDRASSGGARLPLEQATSGTTFAEEGVLVPQSIAPGFGELTLSVNSTRLSTFAEAIRYLTDYPFNEFLDSRLNRTLPGVLFKEAISAFADAPEPGTGSAAFDPALVKQFFAGAARYQLADGGFSYSPEYRPDWSSPYMSVRMAHVYYLAKQNGFAVDGTVNIDKLLRYLAGLYNNDRVSRYVKIYSLYVQALFGRHVELFLNAMEQQGDSIGMTGYGMVGLGYHALKMDREASRVLDRIKKFIRPGTQSIDLTESYEARDYFDSQVQSLALLQMLYQALEPGSEMTTRIAQTLLSRQKHGHWVSTGDTAWALTAYASTAAEETGASTDFRFTAALDKSQLFDTIFSGQGTDPVTRSFPLFGPPLSGLDRNKLYNLTLTKAGTGMAYYSATIRYALPSEVILPRDEGFSVYTRVTDLSGNPVKERELTVGKTYRFSAIVSSAKARTMVALRVPVPSGAEILDASFVTTGRYTEAGGVNSRSWSRETVYGQQASFNGEGKLTVTPFGVFGEQFSPIQHILDNEVRYFFDEFYSGRQEVRFLFRATSPGIFPTPPAMISCMYEPEVFGRGAGTLYVIK